MGFKAVGVYIFAGGFTKGVVEAGFDVPIHLEKGTYGVATSKANFKHLKVWQHPSTWPLDYIREEVQPNFIYCNPPCAAFSMAGASLTKGKTNWLTDGRVQCILDVFHVLKTVQPPVLVWESVTQAFLRGRSLIEDLTKVAHGLGYSVTYLFTSAFLHGVPQPRHRFKMFCHKIQLDFPKPKVDCPPSIQNSLGLLRQEDGTWTQECPIWGLPNMTEKYYRLAKATAMGDGLRDAWADINYDPETDTVRPPHWCVDSPAFMAHRLQLDGAGHTFTGAVMEVHPIWTRWVANSEVARLCGYPDDYTWVGETPLVRQQICQAVLPPVGRYTGEMVKAGLEKNKILTGSPTTQLVNHLEERQFLLT